jgi:hypothetical protein
MRTLSRVVMASVLALLTFGVVVPTHTVATELREELVISAQMSSGESHATLEPDRTTPATLDCGATHDTNDGWSTVTPPIQDPGPPCGWAVCGECRAGRALCINDCGFFWTMCT